MAITFRCPNCRQFLGISENQAGAQTSCPKCGESIQVPTPEQGTGKIRPPDRVKTEVSREAPPQPELVEPPSAVAEADPLPFDIVEALMEPSTLERPIQKESNEPLQQSLQRLQGLLDDDSPLIHSGKRSRSVRFGPGFVLVIVVVSALAGALIGRAISRSPLSAVVTPGPAPKVNGFGGMGGMGSSGGIGSQTKISGIVTYGSATGEPLPDRGARILLLPIPRLGSVKIAGAGLRVGANGTDLDVLIASAKALGGACLLANSHGEFAIDVPSTGKYGLLVVSRYQSRLPNESMSENCQKFLEMYFDKPDSAIGQLQTEFREIMIDGSPQSGRTIHFQRR